MKNGKMKLSGKSIFWEDAKNFKSNLVLVVVLKSQGFYCPSEWRGIISISFKNHINFFEKIFTLVPSCNERRRGSFQNTCISSFGNLVGSSKISATMVQQEKWKVQHFCRKGMCQLLFDLLQVYVSQKIVVFQAL